METAAAIKIENWADVRELVLMCVGTDRGTWWADPSFGSDLWKLRQEGKVDGRTAGRVQQMVLDSLKWMKDGGIAAEIDCRVEQAGKNEIGYVVTVKKPGGETMIVKDTWDAVK